MSQTHARPDARPATPKARHWLRLTKGIYGDEAVAAYFAEHPEDLEPFLTPEHAQEMKDEYESWMRFCRAGQRRERFEAVAEEFYAHQAARESGEVLHAPLDADRAPRRQHAASASKSTRGPTSADGSARPATSWTAPLAAPARTFGGRT